MMKFLILFSCTILLANAISQEELWKQFKSKHNKVYHSSLEEKLRFEVFKDNLQKIEEHNVRYKKGEVSWYTGINKFADMTQAEFEKWLKLQVFSKPELEKFKVYKSNKHIQISESLDWRDQGAVVEVKDQGYCSSCWAFSATGVLEGQNAIINNESISLSEQNLIDCSASWGNMACSGGNMVWALNYAAVKGLQSEADYPYVGYKGEDYYNYCSFDESKVVLKARNVKRIESTENELLQAIAHLGPISVGMDASTLKSYAGGIFDDEYCYNDTTLDHGILAVGYGTENNKDYFTIKNSWGKDWGEKGYFRIRRNSGLETGLCGIASYSTIAFI